MNKRHRRTLEALFAHPVRAGIAWRDIEALFGALQAEVTEREGSRISVVLEGETRVFHRPHPRPDTPKATVRGVRDFLTQ